MNTYNGSYLLYAHKFMCMHVQLSASYETLYICLYLYLCICMTPFIGLFC